MRQIPLTRGLLTTVDEADYWWLVRRKWYAAKRGQHYYAYTGKRTPMARLLTNAPVGLVVDHINGDTLDNRRSNLRVCTQRENKLNTGPRRNSKSGYRGVTYKAHAKAWMAQIQEHGRFNFLGYYKTPEAAAEAYDGKAIELRGEFARLNLPQEEDRRAA